MWRGMGEVLVAATRFFCRSLGVCVLLFSLACTTAPEKSHKPEHPGKTPPAKKILKKQGKSKHGMLAPPSLDGKVEKITSRGIEVFPKTTGRLFLSGRYYDSVVTPEGFLATACLRGVDLFDIRNPGDIKRAGSLDTPGHAWSVCRVKNTLWVADGYAGVTIMDTRCTHIIARWPELTNARAFYVTGTGNVLVCRHRDGAVLLAPEIGTTARVIAKIVPGERVFSGFVQGNRVYLGTKNNGYYAYDISRPEAPELLWNFQGPARIMWCTERNGLHYLADRKNGLWILADRGEAMPEKVSMTHLPGLTRRGAFISDTLLVISGNQGLNVLNIAKPETPVKVNSVSAQSEGRGVLRSGSKLFFSDGDRGIKCFQWDASGVLHMNGEFHQERLLTDVMVHKGYALATNTKSGLQICRIHGDTIQPAARFTQLSFATGIDISGDLAGVVDYDGLTLIDIANPEQPVFKGKVHTPGRASGICLQENYAYVADWFSGLQIVDISRADKPKIIGEVKTGGWALDVAVRDGFAQVCCVNGGLTTVDIHDARHPGITHVEKLSAAPEGIAITDSALYLADFNSGILIFSMKNPGAPELKKWYPLTICKGVEIQGTTLVAANYVFGIKIFDITDPFKPVLTGELDTPGKAYEAAFISPHKREILVADWHALLHIQW